jgi:hypothetical protein
MVRRHTEVPDVAAVNFKDESLVLNQRALGFGWHDFPISHVTDTRPVHLKLLGVSDDMKARLIWELEWIEENGDTSLGRPKMLFDNLPREFGFNVYPKIGGGTGLLVMAHSRQQAEVGATQKFHETFPNLPHDRTELVRDELVEAVSQMRADKLQED